MKRRLYKPSLSEDTTRTPNTIYRNIYCICIKLITVNLIPIYTNLNGQSGQMSITVQIDIPGDKLGKANEFYLKLFGRKVEKAMDHVEGSGEGIGNISGSKEISAYIGVHSTEEYTEKIEYLGVKALIPKMAVQGWGYLAICMDTANNIFNLWEKNLIPGTSPNGYQAVHKK